MELSQHKVLIANRGEVVSRVAKTLAKLGVKSVGLFCTQVKSAYPRDLDQCIELSEDQFNSIFTDANALIEYALNSKCTAIHPGWGFLSENADFAQLCKDHGLVFIGPKPESMSAFANKGEAKRLAKEAGVKILDSVNEVSFDSGNDFINAVKKLNFPVILKPALGGGGKGMTIVKDKSELESSVKSAKRISMQAFADDKLLAETYLKHARHVEVQIFSTGENVYHFRSRDCTMQRRYQKIIEESYSTFLSEAEELELCEQAVALMKSCNYESLGTVEFIIDQDKSAYFMEVNTRLQVEHGVTELVYGVDLVELQVKHALGESFNLKIPKPKGHAIQLRIYAENSLKNFMPASGEVKFLNFSDQLDRVDSDLCTGSSISSSFDPMMAKVLLWADTREKAIRAITKALKNTAILGLEHNINILSWLLEHEVFINGSHHIQWIEENVDDYIDFELKKISKLPIYQILSSIRNCVRGSSDCIWYKANLSSSLPIKSKPQIPYKNTLDKDFLYLKTSADQYMHVVKTGPQSYNYEGLGRVIYAKVNNRIYLHCSGRHIVLKQVEKNTSNSQDSTANLCLAPLNGVVKVIYVKNKQDVNINDVLMVVEAMKMEYKIIAPRKGVVETIEVSEGQQVQEEQVLLKLKEIQ